jgi:Zn-dependent peptidase ImmA (M78 family)/transcriptional regulator with XRE-family HTH domain
MSRATFVPITPSVLDWAIGQAGVDVEDVAERAGVESRRVDAWIAGDAQPTKTQFRRLAGYLKRPDAFFFLPEPPSVEAIPPAFRHPPGGSREPTRIELEGIRRARRAQQVGRWIAERVGDERWESDPAPSAKEKTPKDAARLARAWLAWSLDDQREASSASAVVKLIRARLEERGVLTLQLSLGQDGGRGFSLYDACKPLVAINTHYNNEARLFSYLHEVGHLMRRTDSFCIGFSATKAERWCESFAASFLIPVAALRDRLAYRFGPDTQITEMDQLRRLAADFRVSLSAMAIRLEELELGRIGLFEAIPKASDFKQQGGGPGADNTRGAVRLRELGDGYFGLMLAGEQNGALGRQDVLRYLDVSESQLRRLHHDSIEPFRS